MPSKKNKNQARNPFYFYMVSLRPQLERQGVVLENGMQTLAELAGPKWKDLPEDEKEVYQEMAKQAKSSRRYGSARNDRMDCTGQLISRRVDTVGLNEDRRRRQRAEVKSAWPPGKLVCDEKFYMIGFMSLCQLPDDQELPVEIGVAEFSINGGIMRTMHRFIRPGNIPIGFRYTAVSTSEKTHKIPLDGLAKEEDNYRRILMDVLLFINPEGLNMFAPVYVRISETKQTEVCLDWLARHAEMPNRLKKVYELEGLICDLYSHINDGTNNTGISKAQATDLISSTVFDFEPGARCEWHEEQEVKCCALGTVKRFCYCMADFLCPQYNVALTPAHVPERPEGTYCTVLSSAEPRISSSSAGTSSSVWAGDEDDDSPYASRDYRYKGTRRGIQDGSYGETSATYHRSGPTYDSQSLQSRTRVDTVDTQWQPDHQQQPNQAVNAPGSSQSMAPPIGRGRGRGRSATYNQPLRRPNLPGLASVGRGAPTEQGTWAESSSAATQPSNSEANVPSWALTSNANIGFGRGSARAPTSKPKVYAGAANAPHPSAAPPPPFTWQQEQQQRPQQQTWAKSSEAWGRKNCNDMSAMIAHMNTRDYY